MKSPPYLFDFNYRSLDFAEFGVCYLCFTVEVMMALTSLFWPSIWGHLVCKSSDQPIKIILRKLKVLNFFRTTRSTSTTLIKGHSNSQVLRVYIYPPLVSFTNHVRVDLSIVEVLFCSHNLIIRSDLYSTSNFGYWFILWFMASSPRSVLEAAFQCEAAPICLEERPSVSLEQALHRTLAGRLLTAKRPSVPNLTLAASRLWNCSHRLTCYDHGKCLYSFEFTYSPDVEKVVAGGPWYINGDLLLISRMNPNQAIEQLPFSFTKLWVRCYDLPPKCFTKDYAEAIGNSLGRFCETDLPPEDPEEAKLLVQKIPTVRKYLRVKFEFNLYGPLKSTQSIKICNPKKVVIEEHISRLTYERLPHTCFRCGFLGHLAVECSFEGPLLYGEWIRAELFYRINLHNNAPKVIPINKDGQSSSSQRVENQVVQVNNVADLVCNLVSDPSIIRADYSQARAEGPLPTSKGKSPMLPILPPQHSGNLIPYTNVSPTKSVTPTTVFGPSVDSIMSPLPTFSHSQGSPLANDSILIDNDEGHFVSFLNSISSLEEGTATNPSRCLFPHPVSIKNLSPPKATSPTIATSTHLSSVFKEELRKLPVGRKRAPSNPVTPRPKRGRQASSSDGPV